MLETSNLPSTVSFFPGITERVYYQNPDTKEFWFHATSVCDTLGYANVTSALSLHCDDDEKFQEIWKGKATWFVSEAGCYGLAMGAKNETAKKFKRWLKHDVLKKLRASGGYIMPSATSEQLEGLQAEIAALIKTKNLLAGQLATNIINLASKHNRVTYKKLLEVIQNCLSSSTAAGYTYNHLNLLDPDRMKQIVKAWCDYAVPNDGIDFPLRYRELVPFLRCVADNYYLSGTGGSGEQKYLQQLMSDLPQ